MNVMCNFSRHREPPKGVWRSMYLNIINKLVFFIIYPSPTPSNSVKYMDCRAASRLAMTECSVFPLFFKNYRAVSNLLCKVAYRVHEFFLVILLMDTCLSAKMLHKSLSFETKNRDRLFNFLVFSQQNGHQLYPPSQSEA